MPSTPPPAGDPRRIVHLLLAAGAGRRLGGPKALIGVHGLTLVRRLIRIARAGGVPTVIVVAGAEADRVSAEAAKEGAAVVENRDWHRGQTSSLKAALRALPPEAEAFLIHPVDHAFTTADDLQQILRTFQSAQPGRPVVVRPVHDSRDFGHPVLFAAAYRDDFLTLADPLPARIVYQRARANHQVLLAPVANPLIARDLDTPEDLPLLARLAPLP